MSTNRKTEIFEYGIHAFCSGHQRIRTLKRQYNPYCHGFRVWPSSWLLMDFLEKSALPKGVRVLDVGCGWGLGGIYCAKKYGATVTGADIDPKVFPYLRLHAEINSVSVATILKGIDELTYSFLKDVDVIIGADICFWDTLGGSLERLVGRALDTGVKLVLIADPGRLPFDKFGEELVHNMKGQMWTRTVQHPYCINGKVLKIGSIHS